MQKKEIPLDIDAYLEEKEACYADLKPGTSKRIIWAQEKGQKTDLALVYLHGFTASLLECSPMAERLASSLGANLFYTRLAGHGRSSVEASTNIKLEDWKNDSLEAFGIGSRIGDKIILIGCSTGASLSLWLASQLVKQVDNPLLALLMLSPNFMPKNRFASLINKPLGNHLLRMLLGDVIKVKAPGPLDECVWSFTHHHSIYFPMMQLIDEVKKIDLSAMPFPLQLFYSERDQVVRHDIALKRFKEWGADKKESVLVSDTEDREGHILCGNVRSPSTTALIVEKASQFINSLRLKN